MVVGGFGAWLERVDEPSTIGTSPNLDVQIAFNM